MSTNNRAYAESLRELIDLLPLDSVDYAFAYGSGAVCQLNEEREMKVVDFILATRDPLRFHAKNLERNCAHYSMLRLIGAKNISVLQTNFAAHIYYNTLVQSRDGRRIFKYGVMSVDDMRSDLLDWRWLYTAGRLHKPVLDVIEPCDIDDSETKTQTSAQASIFADNSVVQLKHAILENRRSALQAALLLLPDTFSYDLLFRRIVGLSYTGDFRMIFGEDRNKIQKIVSGAMEDLKQIYSPLLSEDSRVVVLSNGSRIEQDSSSPAVYHRLNLLPSTVLDGLYKFYRRIDARPRDIEEIIFAMAHRHDVAQRVEEAITGIVRPVALRQTFVNALSAGVLKSLQYSSSKIIKMFRSIRR